MGLGEEHVKGIKSLLRDWARQATGRRGCLVQGRVLDQVPPGLPLLMWEGGQCLSHILTPIATSHKGLGQCCYVRHDMECCGDRRLHARHYWAHEHLPFLERTCGGLQAVESHTQVCSCASHQGCPNEKIHTHVLQTPQEKRPLTFLAECHINSQSTLLLSHLGENGVTIAKTG